MLNIKFLGAAGTVTGSSYHLFEKNDKPGIFLSTAKEFVGQTQLLFVRIRVPDCFKHAIFRPYCLFVLYTTGITIFLVSVFRDFLVVGIPAWLRHGGLGFDDRISGIKN